VELRRLPDHGRSPSAAVDATGAIHLIYFTGDPQHGEIWYVRNDSKPLRVNADPGSAVILGGVRGPQLALGHENRVHVLWNGSDQAKPRSPGGGAPLLYCRTNAQHTGFEPERNLLTISEGLDGGAAISAMRDGIVTIAWHALPLGSKDTSEGARRVWITGSIDDGKNTGPERPVDMRLRGACACCGISIAREADQTPRVLYRTAFQMVHRDMALLRPRDNQVRTLSQLNVGKCVMSTSATAGPWLAWEASDKIEYANLDPQIPTRSIGRDNPKHPTIALDPQTDRFLIAWTEKTKWATGGSLVWQVFDEKGEPIPTQTGRADDLPAWDNPCAVAIGEGRFVIFY
jgi:hypothetical protein